MLRFYGFDISEEMLITARKNVEKYRLTDRIFLAKGDATDFSQSKPFNIDTFDRVFYSYTLSMIPPWQTAVEQGVFTLSKGGSIHIVDFGQQEKLPSFFRRILQSWLAIFHVTPRKTLLNHCEELATKNKLSYSANQLYRGYAWELSLANNL